MHALRAFPVLAALLLAAPACETTRLFPGDPETAVPRDVEWMRGEPFAAPSRDVVWARATEIFMAEGWRVDSDRSHPAGGLLVTSWVTRLAPTRYEGKRRRAHVLIEEAGEGKFVVSACVLRQRNADIDDPQNAVAAQWEEDAVDANRTQLVLWKIERPFRE